MGRNISVVKLGILEEDRDGNRHMGEQFYDLKFVEGRYILLAETGVGEKELANRDPPLAFYIERFYGEHPGQVLIGEEVKIISWFGKYEKGPRIRINQEMRVDDKTVATKWLDYVFANISNWPNVKPIRPPKDLLTNIQELEQVDIKSLSKSP